VGPRASLDRCGKSHPPPGFDPRAVQPIASPIYYIKLEHLTHKTSAAGSSFQHSWAIHSGVVLYRILPEYAVRIPVIHLPAVTMQIQST